MTKSELFNEWLKTTEVYQAGKTFEDLIRDYGFSYDEILRLAGNESTIGTSANAVRAAKEACESSNFYDEPKSESLVNALREVFSQEIDMIDLGIVCANGMDSIIEHCLNLFTKTGDSIINMSPTFIYYDFAAKRMGLNVIDVPRKETGSNFLKVDIDAVIEAIDKKTKLIFLCSPNNPDGGAVELSEIAKLAKVCQKKDIVLFIDHAYIEFTERKSLDARSIIKDFPNMIIGYTFSKAYAMAGFRVGYGLMHKDIQEKFLTLLTPFLISKASIAAAKAALLDKEHLEKILENNHVQKLYLEQELESLGLKPYQSEANFLLFKNPSEDLDIYQELLKRK